MAGMAGVSSYECAHSVMSVFGSAKRGAEIPAEDSDNDYILHLRASPDLSSLAVSISSGVVKNFDAVALRPRSKVTAAEATISGLRWHPSMANVICATSADGYIRMWDLRSSTCVMEMREQQPIHCCDFGPNGDMLATGLDCHVGFWDLKKQKKLGQYSDVHTDAVTSVQFHPTVASHLISASDDGLVNIFDTSCASEDDACAAVINAESSVSDVSVFGPHGAYLCVLTRTETVSLWSIASADRLAEWTDLRAYLCPSADSYTAKPAHGPAHPFTGAVDSFVCSGYNPHTQQLNLVCTGFDGTLTLAEVTPDGVIPHTQATQHTDQIRCAEWAPVPDCEDAPQVLYTGGEDGLLCVWRMSDCEAHNRYTPQRSSAAAAAADNGDARAHDTADAAASRPKDKKPSGRSTGSGRRKHTPF